VRQHDHGRRHGRRQQGTSSGDGSATRKLGKALSFASGRSAVVHIAVSAALHLTTGMTLEAWVNPSVNGGSWRTIVFTSSA
jgi:amino acid permease